jgi:MFS family permease
VTVARTTHENERLRPTGLGARAWWGIVVIGLVGQIAWTVENMYLNVFVYDTITDDPTVIAVMVAASAISATLAAFVVGAYSDRIGRRRVFVSVGYVLWGTSTAAFGLASAASLSSLVPITGAATVAATAVILIDVVMSFLGASANDAAFNAWVTDITDVGNRGRVDGVLAVMPLMAMLLVFGALDGLTRAGLWQEFFAIVGLVMMVAGVVAWFLIRDKPGEPRQSEGLVGAVLHGLRPSVVRGNPNLYLTLSALAILGVSTQVFLPYLIIYIQRYLRIEAYALVLAVVLIGASVAGILGGRVIDRVGKVRFMLPATGIYVAGLLLTFLARGMVPLMFAGFLLMSGFMLTTAAIVATVRDYTPADRVGAVQGLRMVFFVLLPMVIGPFIGAAVIRGADEVYTDLGQVRQVPTPWIFPAAAVVAVLIVIPVLALRRRIADGVEPPASAPPARL